MMIHLTGIYAPSDSPDHLMAKVSINTDDIVVVTEGSPSMIKTLGYTCGAVIRLRRVNDDVVVTEDYSTVLRLINNAHNESDVDHL